MSNGARSSGVPSVRSVIEHASTYYLLYTGTCLAEKGRVQLHLSTNKFLVGDRIGLLYAGKLVKKSKDELALLAWRQYALDGSFVGESSDPFPVRVDLTGNLSMKSLEE